MNVYRSFHPLLVFSVPVVLFLVLALTILSAGRQALSQNPTVRTSNSSDIQFDLNGNLLQPTGYRKWIHVGTPLTPHDMNGAAAPFPEFHSVYMNPVAFEQYENTGTFADGTVLVKELVSVGSKRASSGEGYFMGDFIGLEVSIKDSKRFKNEPGNWAFFSFGHSYPLKKSTTAQPAVNCNACHGGVADEDYVFTQYYPVLRAAKPSF